MTRASKPEPAPHRSIAEGSARPLPKLRFRQRWQRTSHLSRSQLGRGRTGPSGLGRVRADRARKSRQAVVGGMPSASTPEPAPHPSIAEGSARPLPKLRLGEVQLTSHLSRAQLGRGRTGPSGLVRVRADRATKSRQADVGEMTRASKPEPAPHPCIAEGSARPLPKLRFRQRWQVSDR